MKSEMKRQMKEMVAKAREIGAVQRVWRRLNPERDVRVLLVRVEQWQRPATRKRRVLKYVLQYPNCANKVKVCLLPDSADRKTALRQQDRITQWHQLAARL